MSPPSFPLLSLHTFYCPTFINYAWIQTNYLSLPMPPLLNMPSFHCTSCSSGSTCPSLPDPSLFLIQSLLSIHLADFSFFVCFLVPSIFGVLLTFSSLSYYPAQSKHHMQFSNIYEIVECLHLLSYNSVCLCPFISFMTR